jgi:hypothetical protein
MTLSEISKHLKGKVGKEERFFRCIIAHLIHSEGVQTLYSKKMFCNYLLSIGEKDGSEMFLLLKERREVFLNNTENIILQQLIRVE